MVSDTDFKTYLSYKNKTSVEEKKSIKILNMNEDITNT